jgi:hypothetical protein
MYGSNGLTPIEAKFTPELFSARVMFREAISII